MLSNPASPSPTQDLPAQDNDNDVPPNPTPADLDPLENLSFDKAGHNREPMGRLSAAESHAFLAQLGQGRTIKYFPNATSIYLGGKLFLDHFKLDPYSTQCQVNLHFPFANLEGWQMANFLLQSNLSMVKIDKFLSLPLVSLVTVLTLQFLIQTFIS